MPNNGYLAKQAQFQRELVRAAQKTIQQLCLDTVQIALFNECGWTYEQIMDFSVKWGEYYDYYFDSFEKPKSKLEDERDVYRVHLDRALQEILGDRPLIPFFDRYPWAQEVSYEGRKQH